MIAVKCAQASKETGKYCFFFPMNEDFKIQYVKFGNALHCHILPRKTFIKVCLHSNIKWFLFSILKVLTQQERVFHVRSHSWIGRRVRTCLWFSGCLFTHPPDGQAASENQLTKQLVLQPPACFRGWKHVDFPAPKPWATSEELFNFPYLSNTTSQIHLHSSKMFRKDNRQRTWQKCICSCENGALSVGTQSSSLPNTMQSFLWQNQPFIST